MPKPSMTLVQRLIGVRLRAAAIELVECRRVARMLSGCPIGVHADHALVKANTRYRRWQAIWTTFYGWDTAKG